MRLCSNTYLVSRLLCGVVISSFDKSQSKMWFWTYRLRRLVWRKTRRSKKQLADQHRTNPARISAGPTNLSHSYRAVSAMDTTWLSTDLESFHLECSELNLQAQMTSPLDPGSKQWEYSVIQRLLFHLITPISKEHTRNVAGYLLSETKREYSFFIYIFNLRIDNTYDLKLSKWYCKNSLFDFLVQKLAKWKGVFVLQSSLKNCAKILVRRELSDRYRKTQEKFQYQGVELCVTFRVYTLHNSH